VHHFISPRVPRRMVPTTGDGAAAVEDGEGEGERRLPRRDGVWKELQDIRRYGTIGWHMELSPGLERSGAPVAS
jgi:hypothetical protein